MQNFERGETESYSVLCYLRWIKCIVLTFSYIPMGTVMSHEGTCTIYFVHCQISGRSPENS
jgi:hypothetical protein